jgi:hypothetical protein
MGCILLSGCEKTPSESRIENDEHVEKIENQTANNPELEIDDSGMYTEPSENLSTNDSKFENLDNTINESTQVNDDNEYKPLNGRKLKASPLGRDEIASIHNSVNERPITPSESDIQIETATAAFQRININLSMAAPPEVYSEDANYFYFSGGLTAHQVNDFSSGIRVSKSGGAIQVWEHKR